MARTAELHPHKRLTVWFQDEARFGQQGTTTRVWAERGTRAQAIRQVEFEWVYLFGAVCPTTGQAHGCLLPYAETDTMNAYLADFSRNLAPDEHALIVLDRAGWHQSKSLDIPSNVTLLYLPPYSPELNPDEMLNQDVKTNAVRRRPAATQAGMVQNLRSYLRSRQRQPCLVKRYFHAPAVRYAAAQ